MPASEKMQWAGEPTCNQCSWNQAMRCIHSLDHDSGLRATNNVSTDNSIIVIIVINIVRVIMIIFVCSHIKLAISPRACQEQPGHRRQPLLLGSSWLLRDVRIAAQIHNKVGACITNGVVLHDLSSAWLWAFKPWMPEGSLTNI